MIKLYFMIIYLKKFFKASILSICVFLFSLGVVTGKSSSDTSVILLHQENYSVKIIKDGFRYGILKPNGETLLEPNDYTGLKLLRSSVVNTRLINKKPRSASFKVTNKIGISAIVKFSFYDHFFKMSVKYEGNDHRIKGSILAKTEGLSRSEEHTSELQSRFDIVCRLLLEKKKQITKK